MMNSGSGLSLMCRNNALIGQCNVEMLSIGLMLEPQRVKESDAIHDPTTARSVHEIADILGSSASFFLLAARFQRVSLIGDLQRRRW